MVVPQELTPEVWAALPPAVAALLGWQAEQIRILTQRVAELEVKLGKDSTNSSLPPSAAHPHAKPPRPKPKGRRRPGGQPGHPQHLRALLPTDQCQQVVRCVPTACRQLRPGADRQRPAAAPPPGLGTARLPAERNRIPATPARLCLRLFELRPLARRRSQRPGRGPDSSPSPVYSWPASVSPNAGPRTS